MQVHIKRWVVVVTAIGMVLAAVVPAFEARDQALAQTQPRAGVSDSELQAFAAAYVEIKQIQAAYESEVQGVQDANKIAALHEEASVKMNAAVEKEGLTAERYNGILEAVTADEELRQKAVELIEAEQEGR